jgi:hypothetical protein
MNKKTVLATIGAIFVVVFVMFGMGVFGQPSDEQLIQQALDESIRAGKEGRPGSLIEFLANDFEVNGQQFSYAQIADRIRKMKPNIEFADRNPTVNGSSADLKSSVKLSVNLPPVKIDIEDVDVQFEKRSTTHWLIFPAKQWQITKVTIPESSFEQIASQVPSF